MNMTAPSPRSPGCAANTIGDWPRGSFGYGGMKAEESRLKELELENQRLKTLLAEAQLDKEILKEALEGNY